MDFLRQLLFESLPLLLAAQAVAIAIAVAVHRRRLTPGSRRGVWATLAACVLLIVMQRLVVTDREAIEVLVRGLVRAVDDGDMAAVEARVDDAFRSGPTDKQRLMAMMHQRLQQWQVNGARINALTIDVQGDSADVRFRVICDRTSQSHSQDTVPSLWRLRCARTDGRWRMAGIEDAQMGPGVFTPQGGMDLMGVLNLR